MNPLYVVLELGATTFFLVAAVFALRRGRLPFFELVSAAVFGILLEEGDQLIFETYEYAADWILAIDRAPVVIGLTWALIIAGAMRITDALGVRRRYAPFVDSVLALMLDLAFDAVAIRMGLWTWREVGLADGWFGVPAGNFYSWLFVTLAFSILTRWLRDASRERPALEWLQLLVPIPAFVIPRRLHHPVRPRAAVRRPLPRRWARPLRDDVRGVPGGGVAAASSGRTGDARTAHPSRSSTCAWPSSSASPSTASSSIALFWLGLAQTEPMLLVISLTLLAAEVPLALLTERRHASAVPGPGRPPIQEAVPEA